MFEFNKIFLVLNIIVMVVAFTVLTAMAWTNPSCNSPPTGNCGGAFYYFQSKLGIGTQTPSGKLDINTASITEGLYLDGRAAITGYDGDTWLRLNQNSSWASGVYTPGVFRADGAIVVDGNTVIDDGAGWHRSYGNTGWYNGTHGGGWWMTDSTYISVYGGKQVLLGNHLNANTFKIYNLAAPSDPNDGVRKTYVDTWITGLPTGAIMMWSGTTSTIPSGWQLCNGTNGTPDLLAKFVYGVSTGENPGTTGGASSHSHTVSSHSHSFDGYTNIVYSDSCMTGTYYVATSHDHHMSGTTGSAGAGSTYSANNLPPYYKIAFICKL